MPSCVVRGCVCTWKKRDPSIILHCFPKEPQKIRVWLEQTGQYGVDLDKMVEKVYLGKVYDTYRMCSLHFTDDSYHYDAYRRVLKKDAVPTVFNAINPSTVPSISFESTTVPSNYKVNSQFWSEDTFSGTKTLSSSTSSCPVISLNTASSSDFTSQTVIPDSLPPSKKRKLEENITFFEHRAASSSSPSWLVDPSGLVQKPLMVDKAVNTDFFTNKRSCCVSTEHLYRRRHVYTQTKIPTKHRKIMCSLLVSSRPTRFSRSTVSPDSPEDTEFSDGSSSRSSNCGDDLCEDLEIVNLDVVKVEISSDSEMDASVPASSDQQESYLKNGSGSSAGQPVLSPTHSESNFTIQDFDINIVKIEPNIKTEEDQFPISSSEENITPIKSQNPRIKSITPIQRASGGRSPPSRETSAIQTDDEPEDSNESSFHIDEVSEDEDESFLVPSDAEDEDDVKRVFEDLDSPVENLVEEEKYIVFESCLKKLIMMIPCTHTKCKSPLIQYRKETVGSYLSIEVRCKSGHTKLLWESQPRHGYQPLGNVLLSAAVLFSGSSFLKSQHMFKLLNLKSIDKTTYYKNQSMYLFPGISHHWKKEQKAVLQSVQERPLCLAGDKQFDNPGFSAKHSVYSLMDVASKKICSLSVEPVTQQVTLEGLERKGFQKAMGELKTMKADVKMIVTDRSVAVQEVLKDNYPSIVHKLDLWHLSKSIGNEVSMAAKHKDCEILHQWVEAIRNHIWWSTCTCCKNPDLLIKKWKSILQHVTNVHEWEGDSDCKACPHPPLSEEVVKNTKWLAKDSAAYEQLKNIVESTSLLNDLKELSFLSKTGELEIYHRTCLKYRPKMLRFFADSMVARTQLAALDHNRNFDRVKTVVKNVSSGNALGAMTQGSGGSKGQKAWINKALYRPICQNFLFDIMKDVIAFVKEEKTFQ